MPLPLIRMDFNSNSLANRWTAEDIARLRIELDAGMRCVFYDLDAEDGENGFLHSAGTVGWDATSQQFRIDIRTLRFRFTPGNDVAVLDTLYADECMCCRTASRPIRMDQNGDAGRVI